MYPEPEMKVTINPPTILIMVESIGEKKLSYLAALAWERSACCGRQNVP
jgi:hypothetical protein